MIELPLSILRDWVPRIAMSVFPGMTRKRAVRCLLAIEELDKRIQPSAITVMAIANINPTGSSSPSNLTNVNGVVYFTANDGSHGVELWKSDGTVNGTVLVKDINPGATGSIPQWLTNLNGTLYFAADDGAHGIELWKSDGTAGGTSLVKDIALGSTSGSVSNLTVSNGLLYFSAYDSVHNVELWKSNGESSGTEIVSEIAVGNANSNIANLTSINGTLYFSGYETTHGEEPWRSDGSSIGTVMIGDINDGSVSSSPDDFTAFNGDVYFSARKDRAVSRGVYVNGSGRELYKTNGNGLQLFNINSDLNGGVPVLDGISSTPRELTVFNNSLYFSASDGGEYDGHDGHGTELFTQTAGVFSKPSIFLDIAAGQASSSPRSLTAVNNTLYFSANGPSA